MYKTVDETFWTDPDIRMLSIKARHLMLYLMTNPHAHYSGIYYLPKAFIQAETDMTMKDINSALKELEIKPSVHYDESRQVVWIVNMFKHQCKANNVEKMVQGVANHLKTLHKSLLIRDFLKHYESLSIPFTDPLPTHQEPIAESVSVTGEGTVSGTETHIYGAPEDSFSLPEKKEKPKTSTGAPDQEGTFAELKSSYPKKNGKFLEEQEVFRRFCLVSQDDWPLLLTAVKNYADSEQVKRGVGIKDPKNFVGDQATGRPYWREWIEPEKPPDKTVKYDFLDEIEEGGAT